MCDLPNSVLFHQSQDQSLQACLEVTVSYHGPVKIRENVTFFLGESLSFDPLTSYLKQNAHDLWEGQGKNNFQQDVF